MNDEFTLRWKNFQDNIASGFQNLYDRGDLVDVTLACDGKLLHAHKIVLAICSPYFQEIFITNPCKHPIIILKDVNFTIMCELLEFMYQGTVNVKHTELQAFMKIGQLLQIKGLAANSSSSLASTNSDKSCRHNPNQSEAEENQEETLISAKSSSESNEGKSGDNSNNGKLLSGHDRSASPSVASPSPLGIQSNKTSSESAAHHTGNIKRPFDYNSETLSIYARNKRRRSITSTDQSSDNNDTVHDGGADHITEDFFFPHISMVESRYDLQSIKREAAEHHQSSTSAAAAAAAANASLRNSFPPPNFSLEYNYYKSGASNTNNHNQSTSASQEQYPNDLHMPNDFSKNFANHMDIPPIAPGEHWFQGKLEFMLSQRGKPLLVHDGHTFGIQYVRKDKKYWQCNLSRKFNCKARVTTTDRGEIIVTNNEHCHTEIRQHLRKDYQRNKVMMNALINLSANRLAVENMRRNNVNNIADNLSSIQSMVAASQAAAVTNSFALSSVSNMGATETHSGILDLGKHSMEVLGIEEPSITEHHTLNLSTGGDRNMPLDCAVHSMTKTHQHDMRAEMEQKLNESNKSIGGSDDWKCNDDLIP